MDVRDVVKHIPKDFWLTHNKCLYVLTVMCHRRNNEFTCDAGKESSVTVAQQRKKKAARKEEERSAVKTRALDEVRKMKAASPTKAIELGLRKKVIEDTVKMGEVKRIEKKLALLEKFKSSTSTELYNSRVQKCMDQLFKDDDEAEEEVDANNDSSNDVHENIDDDGNNKDDANEDGSGNDNE